ncbi:Hypothetical protein PHPALM_4551 [Phytophthora palmivora]|uniref:Uncharacterized protein n=1 Tax=Phytophthora palmivora TaxID=4796 RepID=A0A2P4YJL4_9STRA|nr:Hypothetical protein PHPALM_4551 [Phytophthora palmivora]
MEATIPDIEYLTLAVTVNTTGDAIIIKRDGIEYSASPDDQRYYLLVKRDDDMDFARRVVISVTPNDDFAGTLRFGICVSAISVLDSEAPFDELGVELSVIREVDVEWTPTTDSLTEPDATGKAVYRSLPTQLLGNATLSFQYRMSSDFSSISTEIVLNSTDIQQLWSSDSVVTSLSAWNYVETMIHLSYASTAEIVFRGEVSVEDKLYLKPISIRDFTQESMVGEIEFVRATGGMIYIEVNTVKPIPVPVLLRAYVKPADTVDSRVLRFTDTMSIQPESSAFQGAMDEVRIWKIARDSADIYSSFLKNIAHSDLIVLLPFNSAENTNWFPSGADGTTNSIDFIVQKVNVTKTRLINSYGITGDGKCYYNLLASVIDNTQHAYICDKTCNDGSLKPCGSSTTPSAASVYRKGPIGIGSLSPLTAYQILVEFVAENGDEYEITRSLFASTSGVTMMMEDLKF